MLRRRLSVAFTIFGLIGVRGVALADQPEPARTAFEAGLQAESQGRHEDACKLFRTSLELKQELGPLLKVKDCDLSSGKLRDAARHLEEIVAAWPEQGPELEGYRAELADVEARVPHLTVEVAANATPPTRVVLDGKPLALPAVNVALDPGKHELVIELSGSPPETRSIELKERASERVEVGRVVEPTKPPPPKPEEGGGLRTLGIAGVIVGAVGVAAFGGVIGTGVVVLDKQDEFEQCKRNTPGDCSSVASDGNTMLAVNGVLWGLGLLGVGLGVTLVAVDLATGPSSSEKASSPAPRASLEIGPSSLALAVTY
ncbi:MAG: hypothetical protein U0271_25685 [Polyangiaceae bacterium]